MNLSMIRNFTPLTLKNVILCSFLLSASSWMAGQRQFFPANSILFLWFSLRSLLSPHKNKSEQAALELACWAVRDVDCQVFCLYSVAHLPWGWHNACGYQARILSKCRIKGLLFVSPWEAGVFPRIPEADLLLSKLAQAGTMLVTSGAVLPLTGAQQPQSLPWACTWLATWRC